MKNKGFTLTELLAVLIVLGIIATISYPIITKSLSTYKDDLYNSQVSSIISSTESYVTDHIDNINCSNTGETTNVLLKDLQSEGYIDNNIKNPKTNVNFSENTKVIVTCKSVNDNYKYSYQFSET